MVYSSCINIVAKWYPEKKGWRTGFVNGGWAYGAVPFIFIIGAASSGGRRHHHEPQHAQDLHPGPGRHHDGRHRRCRVLHEGPAEELVAEGDRPAQLAQAQHPGPAEQPARAAALHARRDVAHAAGEMDRDPVRPLRRLLPVRRGLLLRVRDRPWASGRAIGGGRLRRLLAGRRPGQTGLRIHLGVHRPKADDDLRVLGQRGVPAARVLRRRGPQCPTVRHLRDHLRRPVRRQLPDDRGAGGRLLRRDQQRHQLRLHLRVQGARRQLRRRHRGADHDRDPVRDRALPLGPRLLLRRHAGCAGRTDGDLHVQAADAWSRWSGVAGTEAVARKRRPRRRSPSQRGRNQP